MTSLNVALRVIRAEKLAAKDKTGKSDPYVVITTTCDEDVVFRTTTIKQNLAPEWDDIFFFETAVDGEAEIVLTLWDWDRWSSDDILGQVRVPLLPQRHDGGEKWYTLKPRLGKKDRGISGRILVELVVAVDEDNKEKEKEKESEKKPSKKSRSSTVDGKKKKLKSSTAGGEAKVFGKLTERNAALEEENKRLKDLLDKANGNRTCSGDEKDKDRVISELKAANEELRADNSKMQREAATLRLTLQDSETQWKTEREELTAKLDDLRTLYKSTTKKTDSKTKSTETGRAGEEKPPAEGMEGADRDNNKGNTAGNATDYMDDCDDPLRALRIQEAKQAFAKYDVDKSGGIDYYEFKLVMESLRFNHFQPMSDGLFKMFVNMNWKSIDTDGDGTISQEEFIAFFSSPSSQTAVISKGMREDLEALKKQRRKSRNAGHTPLKL